MRRDYLYPITTGSVELNPLRGRCCVSFDRWSAPDRSVEPHRQPLLPFTVFPPSPVCLLSLSSSFQIAHKVCRQLSVLSAIRSCERFHDLLIVVHHLTLLPRQVRLALLTIKHLRVGCAITQMLDLPPFMCGAVNPTAGRGLNAMLS
jgi:hypothetical protein